MGKTCLAKLIVERKIADQTTNTIGFDHHTKEMELEEGIPVNVSYVCDLCRVVDFQDGRKRWRREEKRREKGHV